MRMLIKKVHPNAKIPKYQTEYSSGLDFHALEDVEIKPKSIKLIRTGISIEMFADDFEGVELQIRPRSGLSLKWPNYIINNVGTIDQDYRGEIMIPCGNFSNENVSWFIFKGDRIAQGVVTNIFRPHTIEVKELGETLRGFGGFGSTY